MSDSWFHRLEDDVRHVTAHLHRHASTIGPDAPPQTPGAPVPLADTSNDLATTHAALKASLEAAASSLRDALDNHAARIESLISDVAAVASIADAPLVAAAAGALHVPPEVLDGFVRSLEAISRAFPKPAPVPAAPAAEVPAEAAQDGMQPEQPADPQQPEGQAA